MSATTATPSPSKSGHFQVRGCACQIRRSENGRSRHFAIRTSHEIPGLVELDRGEQLAYSFAPCSPTMYEDRYVSTQLEPDTGELVRCEAQLPKRVQRDERRRGIRAAAAQACPLRDALVYLDVGSLPCPADSLQVACRPYREVVVRSDPGDRADAPHFPVPACRESQLIAEVQKLKDGLQVVVAIRAAAR